MGGEYRLQPEQIVLDRSVTQMKSVFSKLVSSQRLSEFALVIDNPKVLRNTLVASLEVMDFVQELQSGSITEHDIRSFVEDTWSDFRRGEHLDADLTLAAIAVALERFPKAWLRAAPYPRPTSYR